MFYCQIENCEYKSTRTFIHYHHIIPKELGGSDKKFNRVYLCPNCHNRILVQNESKSIHSIPKDNPIEIKGWLSSSGGRVLHYIEKGEEKFVLDKNI